MGNFLLLNPIRNIAGKQSGISVNVGSTSNRDSNQITYLNELSVVPRVSAQVSGENKANKPHIRENGQASGAARVMQWEDRVGTLQAGYYGDLVAVKSDPLSDIRLLENIDIVIKGGLLFKAL